MTTMKNVLITGATSGIGRAAAIALARRGHRVIASGRNPDALATLRADAGVPDVALDTVILDVADRASIEAAMREIGELLQGRSVDVLVNNAGYGLVGPLEDLDDALLRAQFETNVFGLVAVTRAVVPGMRAQGGGRIVNVSSINGRFVLPFMAAYDASKYAVEALSDGFRRELRPFGIDVVIVEPGPIKTAFADRAMGSLAPPTSPRSPYAAIHGRAAEIARKFESQAAEPEIVARALVRAVEARRPSPRIVVPLSARFAVLLFALLPTRLADRMLLAVFGHTRAAVAANAA